MDGGLSDTYSYGDIYLIPIGIWSDGGWKVPHLEALTPSLNTHSLLNKQNPILWACHINTSSCHTVRPTTMCHIPHLCRDSEHRQSMVLNSSSMCRQHVSPCLVEAPCLVTKIKSYSVDRNSNESNLYMYNLGFLNVSDFWWCKIDWPFLCEGLSLLHDGAYNIFDHTCVYIGIPFAPMHYQDRNVHKMATLKRMSDTLTDFPTHAHMSNLPPLKECLKLPSAGPPFSIWFPFLSDLMSTLNVILQWFTITMHSCPCIVLYIVMLFIIY